MTERCAALILLRDARWSTIESGTAKIGTITSGKEPTRTFGASNEKIWKRLGALESGRHCYHEITDTQAVPQDDKLIIFAARSAGANH